MCALITGLIDKQDGFEVIRDQIAAILLLEITEQQALATAAGKDPDLWKLRIFSERSDPWDILQTTPVDRSPIVNIWYGDSSFPKDASDTIDRQKSESAFNIDCYGMAVASGDGATGHNPSDRDAAFAVQRAARLVRNILMSAAYTYLGLQGTVWGRWPLAITMYQPEVNHAVIPNVVAARLAFRVDFNEFSPQNVPETLDLLTVEVRRTEDGQIVLEADYDYTAP